jgi:metal-responsive CopG/Arc/MetJ family transcriptional regulator
MQIQPRVRETFFIDKDILEKLKKLSGITRVKRSDYIREGIAYVLEKYKAELKKAKKERR